MRGGVISGRRFITGAAAAALIGCASQVPSGDTSASGSATSAATTGAATTSAATTGAAATSAVTTGAAATSEAGTSAETSEVCPVDVEALTTGKHTTVETTGCAEIDCEPAGLLDPGCPAMWSGSNVVGDTELGCFHGTKALFAYAGCGDLPGLLTLYIFDTSVSDEVAKTGGGFRLRVITGRSFNEGWLGEFGGAGTFDPDATLYDGGDIPIWVVVDEVAGQWDDYDPLDPPRLRGWLKSEAEGLELYGTFDAALCRELLFSFCPD